jgi:gamma-glutamylputrescine oxidase
VREHPGARIALLEARTVGDGATGRSTGVIGPGVGSGILGLRSRWGDARATAMFSATMDAVDLTLKLVQNEGIVCHLENTSQVVAARTRLHARKLRRQATAFADLGFDVPYLGADELADIVGTECYLAGIRCSQVATVILTCCASVSPSARLPPVSSSSNTPPVHRVANGPGTVLQSPAGRVHARHVVLANDGSPTGARPVDRSVVPIDTHVVRTAPLPPPCSNPWAGAAGPRSSTAAPSSTTPAFHYYRLTHDDRIVFGGGPVAYRGGKRDRDAPAQRVYRRLERELVEAFPALAGLPITDRWYGTTGSTLDRMPMVGQVSGERDVWFSGAWCGHGLALSTASGARIADTLDPTASAAADRATQFAWQRGRGRGCPDRRWARSSTAKPVASVPPRRVIRGSVATIWCSEKSTRSRLEAVLRRSLEKRATHPWEVSQRNSSLPNSTAPLATCLARKPGNRDSDASSRPGSRLCRNLAWGSPFRGAGPSG